MIEVFAAKKKKLEARTKLVAKLKQFLKADETFQDLCKEYGQETDILEGIPVVFTSDLDVTAKTINARVFLNSSLLDEKMEIIARYLLHELTHCLQHMKKEGEKKVKKENVYLNRPEELEAFQYQIKFDADKRSDEKVNDYVNDLISYHKIPKEERKKKKDQLMKKMEK
jgi:hypothetical protein